jgi:hypothetical protein
MRDLRQPVSTCTFYLQVAAYEIAVHGLGSQLILANGLYCQAIEASA